MPVNHPATDPGTDVDPIRRVLLAGGSTIHGLGYSGAPFGVLVAQRASATDVLDVTGVSRTCQQIVNEYADQIEPFRADLAILMIGGTESLIRPGRRVQRLIERFAPAGWHGVAGLEPRARFSANRRRRWRQRASSTAKVCVKHALFRVMGGGAPGVPFDEMASRSTELVDLVARASHAVVVVGLPAVDQRLFPGTSASFARTNDHLRQLCSERDNAAFVPIDAELDRWSDYLADHLHLDADGHDKVADLIVRRTTSRAA